MPLVVFLLQMNQNQVNPGLDYWQLIVESTLLSKAVLLTLVAFSLMCWVVIYQKNRLIGKVRRDTRKFLEIFRKSSRFSEVKEVCQQYRFSPQVALFLAGFSELSFQLKHQSGADPQQPKIKSLESILRVLQRASFVELQKLEKRITILATIAAVAPFVGLFGTVWGIIEAFKDIGAQKSASLVVVAPGIADALIATAAGLFAAIPAVMAYNYFVSKIKGISAEMEDFCLEFLGIVEKNFT
jgi:biopolymer transport protein TolQ